jgi:hypothetical protein
MDKVTHGLRRAFQPPRPLERAVSQRDIKSEKEEPIVVEVSDSVSTLESDDSIDASIASFEDSQEVCEDVFRSVAREFIREYGVEHAKILFNLECLAFKKPKTNVKPSKEKRIKK